MREKWARRIVLITGLIVILLAAVFAFTKNPTKQFEYTNSRQKTLAEEPPISTRYDSIKIEAGKVVYKQQTCASCHSIAGKGNPRNPLDGVGEKHTTEEMRDWITGAPSLEEKLPKYHLKQKQRYRNLTNDELGSLIIYMQSLRS